MLSGECSGPSILPRLQLLDLGHDLVGDLLVDLFQAGFRAGFGFATKIGEVHGFSVFDGDLPRARQFVVASERLEGPEDADGHNGGVGFYDGQSDAGTGGLKFSIARTSAFGK